MAGRGTDIKLGGSQESDYEKVVNLGDFMLLELAFMKAIE